MLDSVDSLTNQSVHVYAASPQPMPLMVWFGVAHVAVGSLAFGAAVALAMIVYRHPRPEAVLANRGIVIA